MWQSSGLRNIISLKNSGRGNTPAYICVVTICNLCRNFVVLVTYHFSYSILDKLILAVNYSILDQLILAINHSILDQFILAINHSILDTLIKASNHDMKIVAMELTSATCSGIMEEAGGGGGGRLWL